MGRSTLALYSQADRRRALTLSPTLALTLILALALTLTLTLTLLRLTADVRSAVEEGRALPPAVGDIGRYREI